MSLRVIFVCSLKRARFAAGGLFWMLASSAAGPALGGVVQPAFVAGVHEQALGPARAVLTAAVHGGGPALILADGSVRPGGTGLAELWLEVDGVPVGSRAVLDWRGTHHPATHGFRVLAGPALTPGGHRIALMGRAEGGAALLAGAGLSVLGVPGLRQAQSGAEVTVQTNTPALHNQDRLPLVDVVGVSTTGLRGPVIVLAAGTAAHVPGGSYGDALWSLRADGRELSANEGTYADNDICTCAELQAPLALQGFIGAGSGGRVSVGAGAEPWASKLGTDKVRYMVPAGATVVALGDFTEAGALTLLPAEPGGRVYRFPYRCIASSNEWPGCPAVGATVSLGETTVTVPAHKAELVSAMLRVQGDGRDGGGRFEMWLTLDGNRVGTTAMQGLVAPSVVSTRTATSHALIYGGEAAETHRIGLRVTATGNFMHLAVTRNLPLVWLVP